MTTKPYFQDADVTIYCGDCREILPELPKVDLVLTDPPYNAKDIGTHSKKYDTCTMQVSDEEYSAFCREWFELTRIHAEGMIFTPGTRNLWNYPQAKWVLCWHKPGAVAYNRTGGFGIWEPILLYGDTRRFTEDFISQTPENLRPGPQREHPCPKNIKVWSWLIHNATESGAIILDPFLGSGTTAVCAKKLGRKSIGIEISEKYCQIAVERLRQSVMNFSGITQEQGRPE